MTAKMNRRSVIKCYITVSAGIFLLPSCLQERRKPSIAIKHIDIGGDEEDMLAGLSEAIIPKTSTPGAADLSAHLFVLTMVDDCFDPDAQRNFMAGLHEFDELAKSRYGRSFVKCSSEHKMALLKDIESRKAIPENAAAFYYSVKRLTIQSFTTSQYFLTKVHPYELVPSRFHGCFPVQQ